MKLFRCFRFTTGWFLPSFFETKKTLLQNLRCLHLMNSTFFNVSWTSDSIRTLFSWLSLGVLTSLLETVFPRTKFCNLEQLTGYLCPELILLNPLNDIIAFPLEEMTEFLNLRDFLSKDKTFSKSISKSWAMLGLRCYLYSYLGRVLLTMYWQRILAAATINLSVL